MSMYVGKIFQLLQRNKPNIKLLSDITIILWEHIGEEIFFDKVSLRFIEDPEGVL